MVYWTFWGMHFFWWIFWVLMVVLFFSVLTPIPRGRVRLYEDPRDPEEAICQGRNDNRGVHGAKSRADQHDR